MDCYGCESDYPRYTVYLTCGCHRHPSQCENDLTHCHTAAALWTAYTTGMMAAADYMPADTEYATMRAAYGVFRDAYNRHTAAANES